MSVLVQERNGGGLGRTSVDVDNGVVVEGNITKKSTEDENNESQDSVVSEEFSSDANPFSYQLEEIERVANLLAKSSYHHDSVRQYNNTNNGTNVNTNNNGYNYNNYYGNNNHMQNQRRVQQRRNHNNNNNGSNSSQQQQQQQQQFQRRNNENYNKHYNNYGNASNGNSNKQQQQQQEGQIPPSQQQQLPQSQLSLPTSSSGFLQSNASQLNSSASNLFLQSNPSTNQLLENVLLRSQSADIPSDFQSIYNTTGSVTANSTTTNTDSFSSQAFQIPSPFTSSLTNLSHVSSSPLLSTAVPNGVNLGVTNSNSPFNNFPALPFLNSAQQGLTGSTGGIVSPTTSAGSNIWNTNSSTQGVGANSFGNTSSNITPTTATSTTGGLTSTNSTSAFNSFFLNTTTAGSISGNTGSSNSPNGFGSSRLSSPSILGAPGGGLGNINGTGVSDGDLLIKNTNIGSSTGTAGSTNNGNFGLISNGSNDDLNLSGLTLNSTNSLNWSQVW